MKRIIVLSLIILILFSLGFSYEKVWTLVWKYHVSDPLPRISLKGLKNSSLVAINYKLLLVPTWEGKLYCFSNKILLWKKDLQVPIFNDIVKYKDNVLVATYDGTLRMISTLNGKTLWKISFKDPITSNIIVNKYIRIAAGNTLYSITTNGVILQKYRLPTKIYIISKLKDFFAFDGYGRVYRFDNNMRYISFFNINFTEQNQPFYFDGYDVFTTMEGVILFYKDQIEYNRISLPGGILSRPVMSKDGKSFYLLTSSGKVFQVNSKKIMNYYDTKFYCVEALEKYKDILYLSSVYNQMYVLGSSLQYIEKFKIESLPVKNIIFDSNNGFYYLGQDGTLYYYLKALR